MTGLPTTVRLTPGRWTPLPGTNIELYLKGKYRDDNSATAVVRWVEEEGADTGFWNLTEVHRRVFVRRSPQVH